MTDICTVFENFKGSWEFTREIHSFDGESLFNGVGKSTFKFTHLDNQMSYREDGMAQYKGSEEFRNFYREYLYILKNDQIDIYHGNTSGEDAGKLYQSYTYSLSSAQLRPTETPPCKKDYYEGIYDFTDENNFTLTTKVEGPNKEYIITTKFHRLKI